MGSIPFNTQNQFNAESKGVGTPDNKNEGTSLKESPEQINPELSRLVLHTRSKVSSYIQRNKQVTGPKERGGDANSELNLLNEADETTLLNTSEGQNLNKAINLGFSSTEWKNKDDEQASHRPEASGAGAQIIEITSIMGDRNEDLDDEGSEDSPDDEDFEGMVRLPSIEGGEEKLEQLVNDYLAQFEQDFKKGIVVVQKGATKQSYLSALSLNQTAGKAWEGEGGLKQRLELYLRGHNYYNLRLAYAMPGGPRFIGVFEDGKPAITQRDTATISAVRINQQEWRLLSSEEVNGDQSQEQPDEIIPILKLAGYHVGGRSNSKATGELEAALEAVMEYRDEKDRPTEAQPTRRVANGGPSLWIG